jgi:hypothetical protein
MSKDLVVKENNFVVASMNSDIAQAMSEEMDGLQVDFDRVKIPTGGGLAFEVPGDDPDSPDMEKELVGVIVDHHPVNAYWENKFEGQNNPPDCSSMDGKQGLNPNTGEIRNCKTCPLNQFGSAEDGRGKACKNMHRVYLLRSGEMFPVLITLPPTSIKPLSNYIAKRVLAIGKRTTEVITKISLKKAQNSSGIIYSQVQFAKVEDLDPEIAEQIRQYSQGIKAITRQVQIEQDEDFEPVDDSNIPF